MLQPHLSSVQRCALSSSVAQEASKGTGHSVKVQSQGQYAHARDNTLHACSWVPWSGMVALSVRSRDSALMPLTTAAGSGLPRLSSGSGLPVHAAVSWPQLLAHRHS